MASFEALAAVTVGQAWMTRAQLSETDFASASVDLKDSFHQFKNEKLASWFTVPLEGLTAAELGVERAFDDETQEWKQVDGGDFVWAAYCGMPMGWSWALWICHA